MKCCLSRNVLGTKTLAETLSERDAIARDLKAQIDHATDPWGIDVSFVFSTFIGEIFTLRALFRSRELR